MPVFAPDSSSYATTEPRYDQDGKVYRQAIAHGTLTALTPYKLIFNEYGPVTAALADDELHYRVIIPLAAVASGALFWGQTGGPIDDVVTPSLSVSVGHAFDIFDGAVADQGADYSGEVGEFAVCRTASTSSTTQDMWLVDREITGTT